MSRRRSISLPKLLSSKKLEESMASAWSPHHFIPAHSRESSSASSASSPSTPPVSNRSHSRGPSSSSSVASTPDSPVNVTKSALHDLVEEPAERDEALNNLFPVPADEPLCICDTSFCEHRLTPKLHHSDVLLPHTPDWSPEDGFFSDSELAGERSSKRRRSGEVSGEGLASRLSQRLPSLSNRWRDSKPSSPVSGRNSHASPHSRSSSLRLPSARRSTAQRLEPASTPSTPPYTPSTPVDMSPADQVPSRPRLMSRKLSKPLEVRIPESSEDVNDRQEQASTPLLPPMMDEHMVSSTEELQLSSPLQSPSVADPGGANSIIGTPNSTPISPGYPTPPLSSKRSLTSFPTITRPGHILRPSSEIPPMSISDETDPWAIKLGHANFHIKPDPYFPDVCDLQTCQRLLEDWEMARVEYMRQAARVSEHYGPTSHTYKLTEKKWAEIDARWRMYHERVYAHVAASGETPALQTLAEPRGLTKIPSLNDPHQPAKFPRIDDADIVGPMVQYAKVHRRPSKKTSFLRIFTDPASLLGKHTAFAGLRR